jgi:hypothetical protein
MSELKEFEWKSLPNAPRLYSNYVHLGWTLDDVRITFGAIGADGVNSGSHQAEEQGSVTMTWRAARTLRDLLTRVLAAYEEKNGEIPTPLLAEIKREDNREDSPEE